MKKRIIAGFVALCLMLTMQLSCGAQGEQAAAQGTQESLPMQVFENLKQRSLTGSLSNPSMEDLMGMINDQPIDMNKQGNAFLMDVDGALASMGLSSSVSSSHSGSGTVWTSDNVFLAYSQGQAASDVYLFWRALAKEAGNNSDGSSNEDGTEGNSDFPIFDGNAQDTESDNGGFTADPSKPIDSDTVNGSSEETAPETDAGNKETAGGAKALFNYIAGDAQGSVQFLGDYKTILINDNPRSSLLPGGGRAIPLSPGKANLSVWDSETSEETQLGTLETEENENGELETTYTPAEPKIVNAFGDAPLGAYTYGEPLYLKLDNTDADGWICRLLYADDEKIAEESFTDQNILEVDHVVRKLIAGQAVLNARRGMKLQIVAGYGESGFAEIELPVSGLPIFVQPDGSLLPERLDPGGSVEIRLLAGEAAGNRRWLIRVYDHGDNYVAYDFDQRGDRCTVSFENLTELVEDGVGRIVRFEIQHMAVNGQQADIFNSASYVPGGVVFRHGEKEYFGEATIAEQSTEPVVFDYVDANGNSLASTHKAKLTFVWCETGESHSIKNYGEIGIKEEVPVYSARCQLAISQHYPDSYLAMGLPIAGKDPSRVSRLLVEIADNDGNVVEEGYINYVDETKVGSEVVWCPSCLRWIAGESHEITAESHVDEISAVLASPCERMGHFTCDGRNHFNRALCGAYLCIDDHPLRHSNDYGLGHCIHVKEQPHMCIRCQTSDIPCSEIEEHTDVDCEGLEGVYHCNGNGQNHDRCACGAYFCLIDDQDVSLHTTYQACGEHLECQVSAYHSCLNGCGKGQISCADYAGHLSCGICKQGLCNGLEHGENICDEAIYTPEPITIQIGDTLVLPAEYPVNTAGYDHLSGAS